MSDKSLPNSRPKTMLVKQDLCLELTEEKMILLKEMMFQYGLTSHQLIGLILGLWDIRDERLLSILEGSLEFRKKHMFEGKDRGKFVETDANIIYKIIEQENLDKQKKNK